MNELPEPLVPAECDLRGLPWMPIDTVRLIDSDLIALSTGDEFKAAVRLWCKAWHQIPAGSLPDDDRILASLSGMGRLWGRVKTMALRGFIACSDGRLYHPVIAEKALEAWSHRLAQRDRAAKRWQKSGNATASPGAHATAHATAMQGTGTGKRTKTGQDTASASSLRSETSAGTTSSAVDRRPGNGIAKTAEVWNAYAKAYEQRYSVEPVRNAKVNGMLAQFINRVPAEEAPAIAAFYVGHSKGLYVSARHCVDLLLRDAEGLRTEWATGRRVTDSEARQGDETAARGEQAERLLAESRRVA